MKKILIFTGAGFCVPLGLPITTGFQSVLNNIYPDLKLYVNQFLSDKSNDVEKVLELLENFSKENGFDDYLLRNRYSNNASYRLLLQDYQNLKSYSNEAVASIKRSIYDILNNFNLNDAVSIYKYLLAEIRGAYPNCAISFFTTNYDLTFEKAINSMPFLEQEFGILDVVFGFSTKYGTTAFDRNNIYSWKPELMEYQKLHGSLDWVKDQFGQYTKSGSSLTPAKPSDSPILYPGYKGVPIEDPFITIHDNFLRKANEADIIVCIGFAFRDPYINNIFESTLRFNQNLRLFCFNPADMNSLPAESKIKQFVRDFGNFRYIKKGVEIKINPLELLGLAGASDDKAQPLVFN